MADSGVVSSVRVTGLEGIAPVSTTQTSAVDESSLAPTGFMVNWNSATKRRGEMIYYPHGPYMYALPLSNDNTLITHHTNSDGYANFLMLRRKDTGICKLSRVM